MQFGRALLRILQNIARSDPRLCPLFLSKIDISDGFYRIAIHSEDVPKLPNGSWTRTVNRSSLGFARGLATRNIVLGWLLDTYTMMIQLPPHRVTRVFELLDYITPKQRRTMVNKWQKLLEQLRSMVLAIQGGGGVQCAPRGPSSQVRSRHTG
jgi:hypothetical protein